MAKRIEITPYVTCLFNFAQSVKVDLTERSPSFHGILRYLSRIYFGRQPWKTRHRYKLRASQRGAV